MAIGSVGVWAISCSRGCSLVFFSGLLGWLTQKKNEDSSTSVRLFILVGRL